MVALLVYAIGSVCESDGPFSEDSLPRADGVAPLKSRGLGFLSFFSTILCVWLPFSWLPHDIRWLL